MKAGGFLSEIKEVLAELGMLTNRVTKVNEYYTLRIT